jgi:hypothetical protein
VKNSKGLPEKEALLHLNTHATEKGCFILTYEAAFLR